ncbi:MAG: hypothetical protein IJB21_01525 [Bacilli bacterium]|nr:hypothetical protein [Bacilli bacterium]
MICGKHLLVQYYEEKNPQKPSIKIEITEPDAPPFNKDEQIGRDSIDLRISSTGYKIKCNYDFINTLDSKIDEFFYKETIPREGYILYPGETLVVNTVERILLKGDFTGEITGRTRYARMGLSITMASKFQNYSNSVAVLQLTNNNLVPLKIFPYQKLAQLIIYEVAGMPKSVRGSFKDELELKKPMIDDGEFKGIALDKNILEQTKNFIQRQKPTLSSYKNIDGHEIFLSETELEKKDKTRKAMHYTSKICGLLSTLFGILISVICVFADFNMTLIIVFAISSALCTIFSMILEAYRENL